MSETPQTPEAQPVIILDRSQMTENIGMAARAMANFGLDQLRLVAPLKGWPQERAWEVSSGADWVLDGAQVFETVADAIADLELVMAATARPRETRQPVRTPREAMPVLHAAAASGQKVGILFGGERTGLETGDIALCEGIITIPIDRRHWSLNLAHAVAINAYEWRSSTMDVVPPNFTEAEAPARGDLVMGMYEHLERELDDGGFFHPVEKRRSMVQNLRVMLGRARFTEQEVATFRGVIHALARGRGRVLAKLAAQRAAKAAEEG